MSNWTKFWIVYALIGISVEVWALARPERGDTLSEQWWALRGMLSPEVFSLVLFMLAGFFGWLVWHFAFQGDV